MNRLPFDKPGKPRCRFEVHGTRRDTWALTWAAVSSRDGTDLDGLTFQYAQQVCMAGTASMGPSHDASKPTPR